MGTFTTVVPTTAPNIQGLSFHPVTGVLYATSTSTDALYTIDTVTGATTLVGAHGAGVLFGKGLAFAIPACPVAQYQVNQPGSDLRIDGVAGSACAPAVTTLPAAAAGSATFASTGTGQVWEAVLPDGFALSQGRRLAVS